jgi:hypothetical protein
VPEIIDVMTLNSSDCQSFVGDSTSEYVNAAVPGGGATYRSRNAYNKNTFTKGDSIRILSGGIVLPESFTFRQINTQPLLQVITIFPEGVTTGNSYYNPNFSAGQQFIPNENYEVVFDTFLSCRETINQVDPTKTLLYEDFYLRLYHPYALKISMLGTPAAIDGKTFYVSPFIKVLHNIPLR